MLEALVLNAFDNAAAALQAANDAADEGFRNQNFEAHHRFEEYRPRRFQGLVKGLSGGDLESQRSTVIPAGQSAQLNTHINHRVTLQHA